MSPSSTANNKKPFLSIAIDAAPDKVWSVATDVATWTKVIQAMKKVEVVGESTKFVPGLEWDETREMFGRDETQRMALDTVDKEHFKYVISNTSCGAHMAFEHRIVPAQNNGCEFQMYMECEYQSWFAQIMSWIMWPLFGPILKKECMKDLEDIKAAVEKE